MLIVSSIIHRCSECNHTVIVHAITSTNSAYAVENTETVKVQSDVYRRSNIQRKGIRHIKTITRHLIFFVTHHQSSIIVKQTSISFIKKWHNTYTKTPTHSHNGPQKELSICLQRFYAPVEVLRYAIPRNFLAFAKRAFATGSHHEKPNLPKTMKQESLILENIEIKHSSYLQKLICVFWSAKKEWIQ